jgi:hypothetical protein
MTGAERLHNGFGPRPDSRLMTRQIRRVQPPCGMPTGVCMSCPRRRRRSGPTHRSLLEHGFGPAAKPAVRARCPMCARRRVQRPCRAAVGPTWRRRRRTARTVRTNAHVHPPCRSRNTWRRDGSQGRARRGGGRGEHGVEPGLCACDRRNCARRSPASPRTALLIGNVAVARRFDGHGSLESVGALVGCRGAGGWLRYSMYSLSWRANHSLRWSSVSLSS